MSPRSAAAASPSSASKHQNRFRENAKPALPPANRFRQLARRLRWGLAALAVAGTVAAGWSRLNAPAPETVRAEGKQLFTHEWTVKDPLANGGDGLGPVFNAKSCVACHSQGGIGGGGDNTHNVNAFQVIPHRTDPDHFHNGVVHTQAIYEGIQESATQVNSMFPKVPAGVKIIGNCQIRVESFDPVAFRSINTPALFGVGLIDELPDRAISWPLRMEQVNRLSDEWNFRFDHPAIGRAATANSGGVGKFGWKGQFATLEDFVATACAVEIGLTNPLRAQDLPGVHKPDSAALSDLTRPQLDALVKYCRDLPRPEQILPENPAARQRVHRGETLFNSVGCNSCHTPQVGNIPGIYSDFALHRVESDETAGYRIELEIPLPSNATHPAEWKTPPLWGVADSAPYFHDGGSATLQNAIDRHAAEAKHVMTRYKELNLDDRGTIVEFLATLRAPQLADKIEPVKER